MVQQSAIRSSISIDGSTAAANAEFHCYFEAEREDFAVSLHGLLSPNSAYLHCTSTTDLVNLANALLSIAEAIERGDYRKDGES